jgi:hypothetical protein
MDRIYNQIPKRDTYFFGVFCIGAFGSKPKTQKKA